MALGCDTAKNSDDRGFGWRSFELKPDQATSGRTLDSRILKTGQNSIEARIAFYFSGLWQLPGVGSYHLVLGDNQGGWI